MTKTIPRTQFALGQLVPISELKEHPKNPYTFSPDARRAAGEILEQYGVAHPVLVSRLSGAVVGGFITYYGLAELGLDSVPVVYGDCDCEATEILTMISDNSNRVILRHLNPKNSNE